MRGIDDSTGKLALTLIGTGVLVGPVLGAWPLLGVLCACGTYLFVASQSKGRR